MDSRTSLAGRFGKVRKDRADALFFLLRSAFYLIAKTHPAALALCDGVVFLNVLPVIGRIAEANENIAAPLDLSSSLVLLNALWVRSSPPGGALFGLASVSAK